MKKQLIIALSFMILFTIFGEKTALCAQTKKETVKYDVRDTRGVRTGSYRETYKNGTVRKVETYDTRGVRRSVVRAK